MEGPWTSVERFFKVLKSKPSLNKIQNCVLSPHSSSSFLPLTLSLCIYTFCLLIHLPTPYPRARNFRWRKKWDRVWPRLLAMTSGIIEFGGEILNSPRSNRVQETMLSCLFGTLTLPLIFKESARGRRGREDRDISMWEIRYNNWLSLNHTLTEARDPTSNPDVLP